MENLSIEDATQLLNYYKQRSSDLEFQLLQLQLKLAKTPNQSVPETTKVKSSSK